LPQHSYTYKKLNSLVGKAIHRYDMISDGDRIVVGVSGGMDSLTLLWALSERGKRVRVHYELFPVYIDPGFAGGFGQRLIETCRQMGHSLVVDRTDHGIIAHGPDNRENPCFLCARLRRKRLFEIADRLDCTKLALGHNKDDLIETLFLNIFYAGEISTMVPRQTFFNGRYSIIRPLAMVEKKIFGDSPTHTDFPDLTIHALQPDIPNDRKSNRC
jgi:tRNA 2-thiocytidine biosynthesis protein TtcA